jgi:isochorismate synthase
VESSTRSFSSDSKESNVLHAAYHTAIDQILPIALWRLPSVTCTNAIIDFSGKNYFSLDDFKKKSKGFVFSKFLKKNGTDALFIKAGLHLKISTKHQLKKIKNITSIIEDEKYNNFINEYDKFSHKNIKKDYFFSMNKEEKNIKYSSSSKAEYCTLVNAAIDEIERNKLDKIVVSRVTYIPLPEYFDPIDIFIQLKKCYPTLFISLVATPQEGVWIGASPEHLLTIKDKQLKIVALAGTQAREKKNKLKDIAWKEKEIREQALVSYYIRHFLQKQALSWVEKGPYTVAAGKIVHLQTDFFLLVNEQNKFNIINRIIEELHPTSAICGMPKDKALAFITSHENYDRRFYCGFLGPININEESNIFVNIRCMYLDGEKAYLYAGTGITSDSIAENEWMETILKIKTLLPILLGNG